MGACELGRPSIDNVFSPTGTTCLPAAGWEVKSDAANSRSDGSGHGSRSGSPARTFADPSIVRAAGFAYSTPSCLLMTTTPCGSRVRSPWNCRSRRRAGWCSGSSIAGVMLPLVSFPDDGASFHAKAPARGVAAS